MSCDLQMFTGWSPIAFYNSTMRCLKKKKKNLSVTHDATDACSVSCSDSPSAWLPSALTALSPHLVMESPALCILCVPYLSDMCLLALVLCSLRGLFVALPAESRTVARTHQGAHS